MEKSDDDRHSQNLYRIGAEISHTEELSTQTQKHTHAHTHAHTHIPCSAHTTITMIPCMSSEIEATPRTQKQLETQLLYPNCATIAMHFPKVVDLMPQVAADRRDGLLFGCCSWRSRASMRGSIPSPHTLVLAPRCDRSPMSASSHYSVW
jgi:hypothetical protein